jgi:hypothetical protein
MLSSLGLSALISPDINIRVSGGHLDRSDAFIDPVLLLSYPLLDIVRTLRPQVDFLKGRSASFPPNQLRCG